MKEQSNSVSTPIISGIYQITNSINSKIYIGSSINIKQRFNDHKKLLRHNKHPNYHLQSSWLKYTESAFIFKLVELVDIEFLIEREQYYIDLYSSFNKKLGYNIAKIAGSSLGTKRSLESKYKMSLARVSNEKIKTFLILTENSIDPYKRPINNRNKNIGISNSGKNNKKSKPVLQLDIDGNLIKEWDSAGIAAKSLNLSVGNLWMCCNNKYQTSYGFIWRYKNVNHNNISVEL